MSDVVKVLVWISTNKVGSTCETELEFDRDDWESMSDEERDDACRDVIWNMAEWGWKTQ